MWQCLNVDVAMSKCKSQDVVLVMGDLNVKVGEGKEEDIVGSHGLGTRNKRGEILVITNVLESQIKEIYMGQSKFEHTQPN